MSPANAFLDGIVAQMSGNPNFLRYLKLISVDRKGRLIEIFYNHKTLVHGGSGAQDYTFDLTFTGVEEGHKVKPVEVNHFMILTPHNAEKVNYEIYAGSNYENHAVVLHDVEGRLTSVRLVPLNPKDEYSIDIMDFLGRRGKVLKGLQAQDLPADMIVSRTR